MQLHLTKEFQTWFGKAVRIQPNHKGVTKDHSMVCWVVSFRGRMTDFEKSFDSWCKQYLKHELDGPLTRKVDYERFKVIHKHYTSKPDRTLTVPE